MTDTTTDRAALARACGLVRPALASRAYVPSQTHIRFDGKWATAYDDKMAIAVLCGLDLKRLVPGDMLVQGLASFGGKDVLFQSDDVTLVMKSGRSKVTLPTLQDDAWTLQWPSGKGTEVALTKAAVTALERCLVSVSNATEHPAQMGVTFDTEDGHAVFYSTDNQSVSRAATALKVKLPGDAPVILPKAFCEQLAILWRAYPDAEAEMILRTGSAEVTWYEKDNAVARLLHKCPVDLEPMDFPRIVKKICGDLSGLKKRLCVIPDEFDSALGRALMVLQGETRKRAVCTIKDEVLRLKATTDMGDADDSMKIDADDVGPVKMDAAFVARGIKLASRIGVTEAATILAGGEDCEFVHLVAHIADVK